MRLQSVPFQYFLYCALAVYGTLSVFYVYFAPVFPPLALPLIFLAPFYWFYTVFDAPVLTQYWGMEGNDFLNVCIAMLQGVSFASVITIITAICYRAFRHPLFLFSIGYLVVIHIVLLAFNVYVHSQTFKAMSMLHAYGVLYEPAANCAKEHPEIGYERCLKNLALAAATPEAGIDLCLKLQAGPSPHLADNCFGAIAIENNWLVACDQLPDDPYGSMSSTGCKAATNGFPGLRAKNDAATYCSTLGNRIDVLCYGIAAQKFSDPSLCNSNNSDPLFKPACLEYSANPQWRENW